MTAVSCTCTDGMQLRLIISVRVFTSLNTSVHKMASPSICVGCGLDISNASGRRLLYTDACQHVYVLWAPLFDEQLNRSGLLPRASTFLNPQPSNPSLGRMCRRCFTVFERYGKLLSSIKESVAKAIDQLMEANIVTDDEPENESAHTSSMPPVPKRLALSTNSSSPDVVVFFNVYPHLL